MGKKSRLKRERRGQASNTLKHLRINLQRMPNGTEASFQRSSKGLSDLFAGFCAEDVLLALGVSDLWLPNISSQVKHHFALGIAAAMAPDQYAAKKKIDTYSKFREFIGAAH